MYNHIESTSCMWSFPSALQSLLLQRTSARAAPRATGPCPLRWDADGPRVNKPFQKSTTSSKSTAAPPLPCLGAPGPRPRTLSSFSPWPRQVRLLSVRPTPAALSCRAGRIHTNFLPIIFSFRPHPHPSLVLHSPPAHTHLHSYLTEPPPPLPLPGQPIYYLHNEVSNPYLLP